jgi:serine/threonine-protein phosphatase PGAM5
MGNRTLYLVRHGQYFTEPEHRRHGHLTPLGRRQAKRTAKRLAELPIDWIYHSDLPRAAETAAIIAESLPDLPLRSTRILREFGPPVPAALRELWGIGSRERKAMREQTVALKEKFCVPTRRKAGRTELIVAHGNLIRYLVRVALGDRPVGWLQLGTNNCGITVLSIGATPERSYLIGHNDLGHLPLGMQTMM